MSFLNKIYDIGKIVVSRLYEGDIVRDAGVASAIFGLFGFVISTNQRSESDMTYWAGAISAAGATLYFIGSRLEKIALEEKRKEELEKIEERLKTFRHSVKSTLENQTIYFASVVKRIEEIEKNIDKK